MGKSALRTNSTTYQMGVNHFATAHQLSEVFDQKIPFVIEVGDMERIVVKGDDRQDPIIALDRLHSVGGSSIVLKIEVDNFDKGGNITSSRTFVTTNDSNGVVSELMEVHGKMYVRRLHSKETADLIESIASSRPLPVD